MAKRKNEPIKVMVNGKERTIVGKRAYPQNLLEAFERIIDAAKDPENVMALFGIRETTVNCKDEYLKYYTDNADFDGEHRLSDDNIEKVIAPLIKKKLGL